MAVFSGIVHFSRLAAGLFSCFLLRDPLGGGADSTVQELAPARLRGPFSRWSKSRNSSLFSFLRASCCRARRGATWTVRCKHWLRPSSVAHALHGQSHVTQQATQGMGSHLRKPIQGLENLHGSSYVLSAKILFFPLSLLAATATIHSTSSAARIRAARAHVRAVRSSETAATTSLRVLLESSVARVPWVLLLLLLLLLLSARDCLSTPCLCLPRAGCA